MKDNRYALEDCQPMRPFAEEDNEPLSNTLGVKIFPAPEGETGRYTGKRLTNGGNSTTAINPEGVRLNGKAKGPDIVVIMMKLLKR